MNLVLVEEREVGPDGTVALVDRRADHLRKVLGVTVGDRIRAGIVAGRLGHATVVAIDDAITLSLDLTAPPSLPLPIDLVLAVPRPKVLTRVLESAATFGVARIDLTNAWRVDKAYLSSPRLDGSTVDHALRLGAEQGMTTHVPPWTLHDRFMSMLDALPAARTRLVLHPGAPPIESASITWPCSIAIGPEGGWIERELNTFVERGFQSVSIGTPVLRVADAVSATLGQLLLLERMTRHASPSS